MIQIVNAEVSSDGFLIFQSLNLNLQPVSYLISGKNGSGKTSLLKLLAGKLQPRSGSLHYDFIDDNLDWDQKFELRKKYIHYVQAQTLHELMTTPDFYYQQRYYTIENTPLPTVRDYLGDRIGNVTKINLPDSFQLDYLLGLELTRLSNGQVKKVVILKQLLDAIPKILLLDYPFEGLDAQSRIELREFLDQLAQEHQVQLIIADQYHPHLPKSINHELEIVNSEVKPRPLLKSSSTSISKAHQVPEQRTNTTVVEMQDVKIQYGEKIIVSNLNWRIYKGERWALTGKNGSGKTTLFSLIYADHPMAYSEKVFLFGKRRGTGESIWDIKKRISYLGPEHIHFLDHYTELSSVHDFLKKEKSFSTIGKSLIDYFQLQSLLNKKMRHLSHGQLQLIMLVSFFLSQKELLLLDEPFQFLDAVAKDLVNNYLHSHLDENTTLILITHYEEDVREWTHHRLAL